MSIAWPRFSRLWAEPSSSGDIAGYRARDGEFHQAIIDQCGNPYVSDAYSQIGFRIQALRSRLSDELTLNRLSFKDHGEMLKLVKGRQVAALQDLLRAHIRQTMRSYLDVLGNRDALEEIVPVMASDPPGRPRVRAGRSSAKAAKRTSVRSEPRTR